MSFIPLLSRKRLERFTPEEYKAYIKSLFFKRAPRSAKGPKKLRDLKVTAKITKKGKISITTRRDPKYITQEEIKAISGEIGRGENEIFIALKEKGFITATHKEAEKIKAQIADIPI